MKRTNIYLAEGQAAALDRAAQAAGVSRAELIRELIDRAIGSDPGSDLAADLAAIDGSFGILAGEDTFTRARDERMDYLDRLRQRVILVDSDVLIEHLRGNTAAPELARPGPAILRAAGHQRRQPGRDRRGGGSPERREVMRLLGSMQRFEVSEQAAWRAATLMREYRRSTPGSASATT